MKHDDDLTALAEAVGVYEKPGVWRQALADGALYTAAAGVLYIGAASYAQLIGLIA